ncbi:leucine-rich repeat domain-containing protein [Aquimarina pacifica]|uniref:leucine-rich repeat domain-containing protein n=1 Tax=Aquimarina pacifica TaxID=1296415 RepID=UPI0004719CBD|nr:hypothetical protein [Aquimarina pacifica]
MKKYILSYFLLLFLNYTFSQTLQTTESEDREYILESTEGVVEKENNNNKILSTENQKNKTTIFYSFEKALKIPNDVKSLKIVDKNLKKVPDISKLINLETLIIRSDNIEEIPSFIFDLKKIKHLEIEGIEGNELVEIPEEIGRMTELEYLSLSANGLKTLPESIGNLTKLETLDLDLNPMKTLPESIKKLTKLKKIYYAFHDFSDSEIEKIKKLLIQNRGN